MKGQCTQGWEGWRKPARDAEALRTSKKGGGYTSGKTVSS